MHCQDYLIILAFLACSFSVVYGKENVTFAEVPVDTLVNLTGNNELWSILLKDCKEPSLTCVQNNVFKYLRKTLDETGDLQFTSYLKFTKNTLDYSKIRRSYEIDSNFTDDTYMNEDESPIESMSRSLQENTINFLMTHDLELSLPSGLFPNSVLKVSPTGFQDHGTLVNLEIVPKDLETETGLKQEGRTIKKIRRFISEKLIYALLAILLIIKLLAVKFLFLLPLIVGAATAKKLLLKILLFVFPFLHHVFKFCAYYPIQAKYHHHKHLISHIHEIAPPKHHYDHHDGIEVVGSHDHPPYDYHGPHDVHHSEYDDDISVVPDDGSGFPHGLISHRNDPTRADNNILTYGKLSPSRRKPGRPLTFTEIERIVAKAEKEAFIKARLEKERLRIRDENIRLQEQLNEAIKLQEKLKQQAVYLNKKIPPTKISASVPYGNKPEAIGPPGSFVRRPTVTFGAIQRPAVSDEPGIDLPAGYIPQHVQPQQSTQALQYDQQFQSSQINAQRQSAQNSLNHGPIYKPATHFQSVAQNTKGKAPPSVDINVQKSIEYDLGNQAKFNSNEDIQVTGNQFVGYQQKTVEVTEKPKEVQKATILSKEKLEQEIYQAATITHDSFYSPILEKIDRILQGLGFVEEPCKERLICSMYKSPTKFSPHSNLLSLELSRDSSELQKPTSTNSAVIRFYKYVQAARDGQDQRDCLRLYPACAINTEVK